MPNITFESRYEYFERFGEKELFELARNPSVPDQNRKLAVEIALKKGFDMSKYPELADIVSDFDGKVEIEEITEEVEPEVVQKTDKKPRKTPKFPPADEAPSVGTQKEPLKDTTREQ